MFDNIARCGIACNVCRFFDQDCPGCEMQNKFNINCLIYNCSFEKDIRYCPQCMEYPCKLMVGLSRAYCPVYSEIKSRKTMFLRVEQTITV